MTFDLHIDIETYSSVSLPDCGVYRYAEAPDFRVLLVAYAVGDEPVAVIDCQDGLPWWLVKALKDPAYRKIAHNAIFERVCLTMVLRRLGELRSDEWLDPAQWACTLVQCARCGLPLSLDEAGRVLGLKAQKMTEGRKLIQLFCVPHEAREGLFRSDGGRADPANFPEEWKTFAEYNARDVEVEREIWRRLSWNEVPEKERQLYALDQTINDRGVLLDRGLVDHAVRMDALYRARLAVEAKHLTGLSNPNSLPQLKEWLGQRLGISVDTLRKDDLQDLLKDAGNAPDVRRVLQIRAEMGKTSNKKYKAMQDCACADNRVRGLFQFHGSRTGRWAGRLVQMQNLPQNHLETLGQARQMLVEDDLESIELCYGNVPDTLSQLIRTAFVAPSGQTFAVCDFSAIEARVLAWLAGERWVLDVFRNGGDVYCATASRMFHVPVEKHGRNAHLRQKGKIAVLALGYQGAVGALDKMGGQRMGLTEPEEQVIVDQWREANPHITALWSELEDAVTAATRYDGATCPAAGRRLLIGRHDDTVTITLPSGRMVCYPGMKKGTNRWGKASLMYQGLNQETRKWGWQETYGGKLTENVVQAIARDCLAETMLRAQAAGIRIVFHVHDELVCEVGTPAALELLKALFAQPIDWAPGLPLTGAGFLKDYYLKD